MKLKFAILALITLLTQQATAQYTLLRNDNVPVTNGINPQLYPWAGGLNFSQFSTIDLNLDGKKDLFVFDRAGDRILCFINNGSSGQIAYTYSPGLTYKFPKLQFWVLMRDYNGDGKEDIFTSSNGGVTVYRNTSNPTDGLKFTLETSLIQSDYGTSNLGLFVSPADIPAIDDIDNDGDLDLLTFSLLGSCVEYHKNLSVENYGNTDTLVFELKTDNWGLFYENVNNNSVTFNDTCDNPNFRLPMPQPYTATRVIQEMPDEDGDGSYEPLRHQGSTSSTLDIDGDGDKELFLGDVSFSNLLMLTNGGSAQLALMSAVDLNFPSYDIPVNVELFPASYFIDVNNDAKPDMVCAPNATLNGENFVGTPLYLNSGDGTAHVFDFVRKDFIQGDMIDVGENGMPVFFDYNNDGLLDLVVGNYGYYQAGGSYKGTLTLYKNIGSSTTPSFKLMSRDWCGLSAQALQHLHPTFGDLDGDGKTDLVVGDRVGMLHFYKNIATTNDTCIFNPVTGPLSSIDVGGYSAPQLFDLNKDGLLDLIVGEKNGNLNYFPNTGTTSNFIFAATPANDNLGQIDVIDQTVSNFGYSIPFVYDSLGTTHLLVGCQRGTVFHYTNIDNNLSGPFTLEDSVFAGFIFQGVYTSPTLADINNDGFDDMLVGVSTGGVSLYTGADPLTAINPTPINPTDIALWPNPANGIAYISINSTNTAQSYSLSLYNTAGQLMQSQSLKGQQQYSISLNGLPQGIYFATVSNGLQAITRKLVVY